MNGNGNNEWGFKTEVMELLRQMGRDPDRTWMRIPNSDLVMISKLQGRDELLHVFEFYSDTVEQQDLQLDEWRDDEW